MYGRIVFEEPDRVGRWVCERAGGHWVSGAGKAIGIERNGELVAGVTYDNFNGASVCMHVASNGSKRWLSREYLRVFFRYPFELLKVKKVIGLVPSHNQAALEFDQHLGFVEEGRVKDAHPRGDIVILTMSLQQCRWL